MTNKTTKFLSVFAITAVAVMMGVSSIAPAYAAQKVINFHEEDENLAFFALNPCGAGVVGVTIATNTFLKAWDNEKFKFHDSAQFNIYTLAGVLVGSAPLQAINVQGDLGDFPISGNFNAGGDGECLNGTTFPNIIGEFHCGNTLQKNGDLIEHGASCI